MATNYIKSSGIEVKSPIKVNAQHPIDARALVDNVIDLYSVYTWAVGDHNDISNCLFYIYDGMVVATKELDEKQRPQLYILHHVNDLLEDYKLKSTPSDPEHWLTKDNWQRLGYVTDIDSSQFSFLNIKYGWCIIADSYEGPRYYEESDDYYNEVYGIDINNVEPGGEGYIPTLVDSYTALKMSDDNSDIVLYVESKRFTTSNIISVQHDNVVKQVSNIGKNENVIFKGLGSIFVSEDIFNYSSQNIQKNTINIGLKWQPIGPKPSEINIAIDLVDQNVYCDILGKVVINSMFEYAKLEERDGKYYLLLSALSFEHRMTYENWNQLKSNNGVYDTILVFDKFADLPKVCKNLPSKWTCEITENDSDQSIFTLSNWVDVISFVVRCKPGSKYDILLKPF